MKWTETSKKYPKQRKLLLVCNADCTLLVKGMYMIDYAEDKTKPWKVDISEESSLWYSDSMIKYWCYIKYPEIEDGRLEQ